MLNDRTTRQKEFIDSPVRPMLSALEPDEQKNRMTDFSEQIHESPMWDESKEMLLPGEIEHRTMLKRQEEGIPLPQNLYEELVALAESLGVKKTLSKI